MMHTANRLERRTDDVNNRSSYQVQALDRSLRILRALADAKGLLGPAELSRTLRLHKTTTHRLLKVMERHGIVRRDPREGKYRLGVSLFELGNRAVSFDLRECGEPLLRRLVQETMETAHICILDGSDVVSIANVEGPWTMRTPSTVGRRTPVYCSSVGKAIIAFLPDDVRDGLLGQLTFTTFTRRTITTRSALEKELARVRKQQFALDNEEREVGLRCVGAPIRNHAGSVIASIAVAGPAFRLTDRELPRIARAVMRNARDLSQEMGYSGVIGSKQLNPSVM